MKSLVIILILIIIGAFAYIAYQWWFVPKKAELEKVNIMISGENFVIDIADTLALREKGLSGRENLGDNEGMLFVFNRPLNRTFWMKGVIISIDIIWILDNRVVGFVENAEPEPGVSVMKLTRYHSPEPVDRVLEVKAGTIERLGIKEGDKIVVP